MKVHEYQAKAFFKEFGIPVPKGGVAATPEEAEKIAAEIGGKVAVKWISGSGQDTRRFFLPLP